MSAELAIEDVYGQSTGSNRKYPIGVKKNKGLHLKLNFVKLNSLKCCVLHFNEAPFSTSRSILFFTI